VFFVLGAFTPRLLLSNHYQQMQSDNEAYRLTVELNASIVNLKDLDEERIDMLEKTLERNLRGRIEDANALLTQSKLSPKSKRELAAKIVKAELALRDRTKTLNELLFSKSNP